MAAAASAKIINLRIPFQSHPGREEKKEKNKQRKETQKKEEKFPDANARVVNLKEEEGAEPWPRQRGVNAE